MPENRLRPVNAGKMNRAAWMRTHFAELGPYVKAGEGAASTSTADVYLDGALIGSVTGVLKPDSTVRAWTPNRIGAGVNQHGSALFNSVDALVRTYLTEVRQHPIAHLTAA
ncbi:hypothetical protein [Pseudarthrobacter sp. ATCC 49987]|uniref:hypothetical protein n=1 Tax=Pseudarthrobacter sp. ATCC 49987 TaxID=2698204 RepID=UPI001368D325|nr:hypothetical protein [Pseudarthrobacter sp. ATCC 49987]